MHIELIGLVANSTDLKFAEILNVTRSFVFKMKKELHTSLKNVPSVAKRKIRCYLSTYVVFLQYVIYIKENYLHVQEKTE